MANERGVYLHRTTAKLPVVTVYLSFQWRAQAELAAETWKQRMRGTAFLTAPISRDVVVRRLFTRPGRRSLNARRTVSRHGRRKSAR